MQSLKHRATAPTPSPAKKGNFFKRHLGSRRRSSVSFPNGQPPSPQAHAHPQPQPQPQKSAVRKASVDTANDEANDEVKRVPTDGTNETDFTDITDDTLVSHEKREESPDSPRQSSKTSGIRWAAGYDDLPSSRPRRASSTGTSRRGSIYFRNDDGFMDGVDAGVGSKARRLSVQLPDHLHVDERPLDENFSMMSRAQKKTIGEGGAAMIRVMTSKTDWGGKGKLVAVKEFREWEPDNETEDEYVRKIKSEYAIAKACCHPNIVETRRLCFEKKKWFHVMEYCEPGDLNDLLGMQYFTTEDKNCMFKQLMRGVDYLHSRGISHRDIKSENCVVSTDGCLKLADFGTAEVFCGSHPGNNDCREPDLIDEDEPCRMCKPGLVGSRPYMAPEIIDHEHDYDPRKVDIWSCAITYITMICGGTPWQYASRKDTKNFKVFCENWEQWLERFPDGEIEIGKPLPSFAQTTQFRLLGDMATRTFILGMLHPDPEKRWSAKDVLDTVTVTEYPCCQQHGYSDDIKTRQRKARHNHLPPKTPKGPKWTKPSYQVKV